MSYVQTEVSASSSTGRDFKTKDLFWFFANPLVPKNKGQQSQTLVNLDPGFGL